MEEYINYKVSVIIPIYNNTLHLSEALKSILNQSYCNIEYIIINDGSTDNSRDVIARSLSNFKKYKVHLINKYKNEGIASAYRDAFNIASGDIIVFLDADDVAYPKRISSIVSEFEKDDNIGFVYHSIEFINQNGISLNNINKLPYYVNNRDLFLQLFKRNYFTGSALAIRNFEWLKCDLDIICCDYYFCLQIAERGYKFKYIDDPLIQYRIHSNNTSSNSVRMFESFRKVHSLYPYSYLEKRWLAEGYQLGDIYSTFGVMEYYYQKNNDKAFRFFDKAEKYQTQDIYTYFYLGCLYYQEEKYEIAYKYFYETYNIDQNCFQALHNMGIICAKVFGKLDLGMELLNKANKKQPLYLLIQRNIELIKERELNELKIISVLTDEDNILMTYCKIVES